MDKIYWNTGQFILGAVSGTIAVSVFAVAIQLQTMYMSFSSAISGVFLPKVTKMITQKASSDEISNLFIRIGRIQNYIMLYIVLGFFIFGKQFIQLWAGSNYIDAYTITLMFFVALLIPLIQNLGIVILQAKNQMKFRSLLYIGIAIFCLVMQIPLGKLYQGIGCAIAISGALLLGQGLIMNIYYHKVQKINILKFWKEICTISAPLILVAFLYKKIVNENIELSSITYYIISILIFSIIFWLISFFVCMNKSEKQMIISPLKRIFS